MQLTTSIECTGYHGEVFTAFALTDEFYRWFFCQTCPESHACY